MEINKILQADYLDLIYDNRNKNYGGYELRKHYERRAAKALGLMLSLLVLAGSIPCLMDNHEKSTVAFNPKTIIDAVMTEVTLPEKIIPPPAQPAKTHNASVAKTFQNPEPVIAKDNNVIKPDPPKPDDLKGAIAGPVTNPGNDGLNVAKDPTPPSGPAGDGGGDPNGKIGGTDTKEVIAIGTDVPPEYPGGMAALLEYLQRNIRYPNEARENQIQGRVVVRFVVNKEGKIEGAEVQKGIGYGCDKEALRVVNAMKTWKPGQVKGKAVKAYYTLPITFRLD
ncbi:energy transducer TonB [Taibaiella lutea]|nr:energy transducer TonB [Taibaiella lutea]